MQGRSHCLSALAAGLAIAPTLGMSSLLAAVPFTLTTGGAGIAPDLDHRSSSASRYFGRAGNELSRALRGLSNWIYQRTKGPRDEPEGKHRHLTHTIAFALVCGGAIAAVCWLAPPTALLVYAACALLTADRFGDRMLAPAAVGLVPLVVLLLQQPQLASWQTGLAVALGMITHDLGDALTLSGCPIAAGLWPFEIAGETWYEVRLLGPLSFRTGGLVEQLLVFPLLAGALAATAVPYLLPTLIPALTKAATGLQLTQLTAALDHASQHTTTASLLVGASLAVVYCLHLTTTHLTRRHRVHAR